MAVSLTKEFLLVKLKALKKGANIIVLKQLDQGYHGITVEDLVAMLKWIQSGSTPEEIKQRWRDSGYIEFFENWLADGLITATEMKMLFGAEKPWL